MAKDENLYLVKAKRFVEADPARGLNESFVAYSSYRGVIAPSKNKAVGKLLNFLENTRYKGWECSEAKQLVAGADIPLEKRVEIIGEIIEIIY